MPKKAVAKKKAVKKKTTVTKPVKAKRGAVNQKVNKVRRQGAPKKSETRTPLHRKMESPRTETPIFYGLFIP